MREREDGCRGRKTEGKRGREKKRGRERRKRVERKIEGRERERER